MPPERISPIKAIRKTCLLCQGGSRKFVAECPDRTCPLYPYRFGTRPQGTRANLLKVIRKYCLRCAGSARGADACTASTHVGNMDPCWLHPYRKGRVAVKKQRHRKPSRQPARSRPRPPERELALPLQ
ncbi:hypothetical protein [Desulfoplanes formicivorans]|uniref:Uncharacterized protein n=1 Tax=Desulfoplanes formicivorans TaxID=1592317 RepID=A0A194AGS4_9BACT|nr:hypothetical protein [Desulfoplanes formicivorans]GAU08410.1 hypothetical protein DPF_1118 [Desulfoplanes formicivorans]